MVLPTPRVLVLHAYPAPDLLDAIARLGVRVVLAAPPEFRSLANHAAVDRFIEVFLDTPAAVLSAIRDGVRGLAIDGVPLLNEGTLIECVAVAGALGLPTLNPATAAASRNKFMSYLLWSGAGVRTPRTVPLSALADDVGLVEREIGFPAVLKISDAMNSQGVVKVNSPREFAAAKADLLAYCLSGAERVPDRNRFAYGRSPAPLIAQAFCDGPEVSVECVLRGNSVQVVGVFEKAGSSGPHFPETKSVSPCSLATKDVASAIAEATAGLRALGADHGVAHVEVRFHGGQPYVLEAGLRPGGAYTAQAVELLSGFNLIGAAVMASCDREMPWVGPCDGAALFGGVLFPATGTLQTVRGREVFEAIDGLVDLQVLAREGDAVVAPPYSAQPHYCYYLIRGANRGEVEARHQQIQEALRLVVA